MKWYIAHHGIKDQKWGVRNGPPYPLDKTVAKTEKRDTIKIYGHKDAPRKIDTPYGVVDHINEEGKVTIRSFYDGEGIKSKEIHTTDHKKPKYHKRGKNGEHAHDYIWDEDGRLKEKVEREITQQERKENDDIL